MSKNLAFNTVKLKDSINDILNKIMKSDKVGE